MTFDKEHQFFMDIVTLKKYLKQSSEQQNEINKTRSKLRELEMSFNQTQKHIDYYLSELEKSLKTCKQDNRISMSPEAFSSVINALSWLENNDIVEQGFLNAIMDDVKQGQN